MDLDCLLENVSILDLSDIQKLANACAKRNNNIYKKTQILHYFWLLGKPEIDTFCDKQSRSIKTFENIWTESSFDKWTFLNNNYANFCAIWSNNGSISAQENKL